MVQAEFTLCSHLWEVEDFSVTRPQVPSMQIGLVQSLCGKALQGVLWIHQVWISLTVAGAPPPPPPPPPPTMDHRKSQFDVNNENFSEYHLYEYYDFDISFDNLVVSKYSIVIGFWCGVVLLLMLLLLFSIVLMRLASRGSPRYGTRTRTLRDSQHREGEDSQVDPTCSTQIATDDWGCLRGRFGPQSSGVHPRPSLGMPSQCVVVTMDCVSIASLPSEQESPTDGLSTVVVEGVQSHRGPVTL
uniref:melanocortin-2 receptor accessory protein 2 isoform X4 n=1 Tax=Myxine glutinosa TaxID=7769 RepID=UPI00358E27CB